MLSSRRLVLVVVLTGWLVASTAEAQVELFVTNQADEIVGQDSVLVYEVSAAGVFTLRRTLAGDVTGLRSPFGVAVTRGKLFVVNQAGSITVYNQDAQGNTPPSTTLSSSDPDGASTGLDVPTGLAVTSNELFVTNQSPHRMPSITVYGWELVDNQVTIERTPRRTITGLSTGLSGPSSVVVDGDKLFVANTYAGSVTVHGRMDNGDVAFQRQIMAAGNQPLHFPTGLAVDQNEIFVSSGYDSFLLDDRVSVFDVKGALLRTITGIDTRLALPAGIVVDRRHDRIFVANPSTTTSLGSVTVYRRTADGNATPLGGVPVEREQDQTLSSPIGLALPPSFEYVLTTAAEASGASGSFVQIQIRAELLSGSGTITFTGVSGLPGATPLFTPDHCDRTCEVTLTIAIPAATPPQSLLITVSAVATPSGCDCPVDEVDEIVSFTLNVTKPRGTLQVNKVSCGAGTVTSEPPGIACEPHCTGTFDEGTEVELTASPGLDSYFADWTGCAVSSMNRCVVTVIAATTSTVTARFEQLHPVLLTLDKIGRGTVVSDPASISCGAAAISCGPDCPQSTAYFPKSQPVTLTPNAEPGSEFAGWFSTSEPPLCEGAESCTFTPTQDDTVSIRAYFGTPQEAFIERFDLNVLRIQPDPGNTQALIDALKPQPSLTVIALIDAYFDGPVFRQRGPALTPARFVAVFYRAILGREPRPGDLATWISEGRLLEEGQRIKEVLVGSPEFVARLAAIFPEP